MVKKVKICNPRYPHTIKIVRVIKGSGGANNPFADKDALVEDVEQVIYEGKGRSFTDTTTEGNSTVDQNKRKSSIPVRYDGWAKGGVPLDGDIVYSTIGNNTEVGMVKDCEPDNNRTLVYWDYTRV